MSDLRSIAPRIARGEHFAAKWRRLLGAIEGTRALRLAPKVTIWDPSVEPDDRAEWSRVLVEHVVATLRERFPVEPAELLALRDGSVPTIELVTAARAEYERLGDDAAVWCHEATVAARRGDVKRLEQLERELLERTRDGICAVIRRAVDTIATVQGQRAAEYVNRAAERWITAVGGALAKGEQQPAEAQAS